MIIVLPPDLERALAQEARKRGITPELLALDCLRARFLPPAQPVIVLAEHGSLADFLADHIGVLSDSKIAP
jgi:hypothetical protein